MQAVLDQHKIVRQAFYGGYFTGNHCGRYMVNNIYKELTRVAVATVGKRHSRRGIGDRDIPVRAEVQQTQRKF